MAHLAAKWFRAYAEKDEEGAYKGVFQLLSAPVFWSDYTFLTEGIARHCTSGALALQFRSLLPDLKLMLKQHMVNPEAAIQARLVTAQRKSGQLFFLISEQVAEPTIASIMVLSVTPEGKIDHVDRIFTINLKSKDIL